MTAFGAPTGAIPIGGYGDFRRRDAGRVPRPRIEGHVRRRAACAPGTSTWGAGTGDRRDREQLRRREGRSSITSGDSEIRADGLFSLGYPRKDGGEEINARIRVTRRAADRPAPRVRARRLSAGGDCCRASSTSTATTSARSASARWRSTMAPLTARPFETRDGVVAFRRRRRPPRQHRRRQRRRARSPAPPTSAGTAPTRSTSTAGAFPSRALARLAIADSAAALGLLDFTAGGSGTFDAPRYDVRGSVDDLFVARRRHRPGHRRHSASRQRLMTLKLEAASPRLAVSGTGPHRADAGDGRRPHLPLPDTSLDPYLRAFDPHCRRTRLRSPAATSASSASWRTSITSGRRDRR